MSLYDYEYMFRIAIFACYRQIFIWEAQTRIPYTLDSAILNSTPYKAPAMSNTPKLLLLCFHLCVLCASYFTMHIPDSIDIIHTCILHLETKTHGPQGHILTLREICLIELVCGATRGQRSLDFKTLIQTQNTYFKLDPFITEAIVS